MTATPSSEHEACATTPMVVHHDGVSRPYDEAWVRQRFEASASGVDRNFVDIDMLTDTVTRGITNTITYERLNELIAQTAAYAVTRHPDYGLMGGRLCVLALHEVTSASVLETFRALVEHTNYQKKTPAPLISSETWQVVLEHHEMLQDMIDYSRDMTFEYFGYKTLERSYLLRANQGHNRMQIIERPQHLYLRVAIGIHGGDMEQVRKTYDLMSQGYFTHATPTLFNSGTPCPQMSSCFLVAMKDDSIEGIYDTLKECALISKAAGGIGVHMHNIRCAGSYIAGTNGTSNGLVPLLRVFNNTARYVDQGGGKRKGAFCIYLEPWHADVFEFLLLRRNTGKDDQRARDLFYALWIPDEFMRRVQTGGKWTLMDPTTSGELIDLYGENFNERYRELEAAGAGVRVVDAKDLWFAILESQIETGMPFMLYKDACNLKSNQQNVGTIKCSNLCTEIVEYTSPTETAVCNLASIALPKFINDAGTGYDHQRLYAVTKQVVVNLNRVIDRNYYPIKEAFESNRRHRPIGVGVQGLADTFILLGYEFTSDEARELNEDIFETIYYAAVDSSVDLAIIDGKYETFEGSPASKGQLQFDLWRQTPRSGRWDWAGLKKRVEEHGMRNSLLIAPMPTASTSQILGNNECFEPFTSNLYVRRVLSGEFPVVNKYLVRELVKRGLWNEKMRNEIITFNGSISHIDAIPEKVRNVYKTVWEIKQRALIDMAADRGKYIDQSQSLNLFLESPTSAQLTSMHFYAWLKGLKTGMYYLRTRPAADAIKFTVDAKRMKEVKDSEAAKSRSYSSSATQPEDCINCGS